MSLFRRKDGPLVFVLLRVFHEELEPLKKIIVENGGAVRLNDKKMPIIFTQSCNYSKLIWPERNKTLIYDIKFIKECVRQRKIVDPEPYRLSEMPCYAECLMSHFLYGGCDCRGPGTASAAAVRTPTVNNRQIVVQSQSQTSSVAEEDFFTATSELSERGAGTANPTGNTSDPLASSASLNRSVKSERSSSGDRLSLNCTTTVNIEINVLSPNQSSGGSSRSTIDESQAVTRPATTHRPTELSCGDDRLTEAIEENEKRPCSVEYHTQVEPKLRMVAQRKKAMELSLGLGSKRRQQRTPTTLTDGGDAPNVVPAPGNTSAILEEITRSAAPCENGVTDGDVVKNEPESPPSPAKSDASTIMAQTSADSALLSRKRLYSETAANETPPESNWITADDLPEQEDLNHPVSKYMRCEDGERRLLKDSQQSSPPRSAKPSKCSTPNDSPNAAKRSSIVLNTFSKSYQESVKSPKSTEPASADVGEKSKYFETPKVTCMSSSSDDSDEDNILITRVPETRENDDAVSVLSSDIARENSSSKTSPNDEDWNKPGPSGTQNHSIAREDIYSDDSSQDEHDGSELRETNRSSESCRSQNARNGKNGTSNKKDSTNGQHLARLRVRRPSDLESMISIDDEVDDSKSTKARDKSKKNNKPVEKNKKSARTVHRELSVDSSDSVSDESSDNTTVIAAKNKRNRQATMKSMRGRSEANGLRNRRKISDDSAPIARKTKARNGTTLSPPIEIVQVDSDSNDGSTSSRPEIIVPKKKSAKNKHPTKERNRRKDTCVSSATDSDSSVSTHPLHNADIYTKLSIARAKAASHEGESGYRTWYTDSERRALILYIVDKNAISRCKGEAFFQVMASEKIFRHRSALSLYNEFRKMLRNIDKYASLFNLTASTVMQFKRLRGDYR